MKIITKKENWIKYKTEVLGFGIFEDKKTKWFNQTDNSVKGELSRMLKKGELKSGETRILNCTGLGARKIAVINLGKSSEFNLEKLRKNSARLSKIIRNNGIREFSILLHQTELKNVSAEEKVKAVTEGIILGLYDFKKYITKDKNKIKRVEQINILESENYSVVSKAVKKAILISENVNYLRDLVNEPAQKVTPSYLANQAMKIAKASKGKLKTKILGKKEIVKLGMEGLYFVSKGSSEEPKFIIMEYNSVLEEKPLVFVGKGITFDSGGLDVKPASYMEDMKSDMAGAATVIATLKTISELGIKKKIVGIIPACENMLGEKAYKQGDIIKAYNGKTIEVWHTDAEGRLILADGLSYAEKHYKAKAIIDIATLTGAVIYALGYEITAMLSKETDLKKKIISASKKTGEYIWELPMIEEYTDLVKGDIADLRNVSKESPDPGTITAGIFLSNFVEKTPWMHLDIGASGWTKKEKDYKYRGGTGACMRTFIQMIEEWK